MPIYIKTDTDEALLEAISLSETGQFVYSKGTESDVDNNVLRAIDSIEAFEGAQDLPWDTFEAEVEKLTGKQTVSQVNNENKIRDLGNFIVNGTVAPHTSAFIEQTMTAASTWAFESLGHPKE